MLDCGSSAFPICNTTPEVLHIFIVNCTAGWEPSIVGALAGRHCPAESALINIDQNFEKHLTDVVR